MVDHEKGTRRLSAKTRSQDTPDVVARAVTLVIIESGAGSSWKARRFMTKPLTRLRKL